MHALRKLVNSGNSTSASSSGGGQAEAQRPLPATVNDQDYALHLQHLRKVFRECLAKSGGTSVGVGQDDRLYSLIPIFVKLFRSQTVEQIEQQFPDLALFGAAVGRLLVHEVKKRAGDRSSEGASVAIAEFFKPNEFSHGWLLLLSLQILSHFSGRLVDMLCSAAIPSTFIKLSYLFFDLPPLSAEPGGSVTSLAGVITEIVCNLLRHPSASEELAKKDVMVLLFIAPTSPCPARNHLWRKCCQEALCCMARYSLSDFVLGHIHAKGCIKICIDNMKNIHQLGLDETFTIFQYFAVFLEEAADRSQTMVDDFRISQGLALINDLGLRLEEHAKLSPGMVEQYIAILKEMCVHGPLEIRVPVPQGPFRLVSFQLPLSKGRPFSVRYLDIFLCLHDLFLRCVHPDTAKSILLAINELVVWDESNYFVLDASFSFLSVITDKVAVLPVETQSIYFNLLRHIVVEVNYVPSKELSSIALVLRDVDMDTTFFKLSLFTLKRILFHDITFQDVYREVGLVEVLMKRFVSASAIDAFPMDLVELLQAVLKQNNQNCPLFRECGGSKQLLRLIAETDGTNRAALLQILQHLLTSVGCDDDIQQVLTKFNNALDDLRIKRDLLICCCGALRESHRTRIAFRKSGAFVSLISAIVALEGRFAHYSPDVADYLNILFETLTTAMRYEPSNAKHFTTEVRFQVLADACRLLGCFVPHRVLPHLTAIESGPAEASCPAFFKPNGDLKSDDPSDAAAFVFRAVYLMALDGYRHGWADSFDSLLTEAPIVYTGAVLVILDLLPAIPTGTKNSQSFIVFVAEILKSLVRHERNQQLMCEAGMVQQLLTSCETALADEGHLLNGPLQYILERLSAQSLRPRELRSLLRMRFSEAGHRLPLSRIKTLVSMITLKEMPPSAIPAFIEFDLSYEGFGGLFLPSIAPQGVPNFSLHGTLSLSEPSNGIGGIGSGIRVFPPTSPGFTVIIWFCIDTFSSSESIRLLDITRVIARAQDSLTCFSAYLTEVDQQIKLLISTRERNLLENPDVDTTGGDTVLLDVNFVKDHVNSWHCLTISMGKSLVKSGFCNIFYDDRNLGQFKLASIPQNPGGGAATLTPASVVFATVGTQPLQRKPCRLRWRLASLFIIEDVLNHNQAQIVHSLGPNYHGTFQDSQTIAALNITEEKLMFGLNPLMTTEMSIVKLRRIFNKDDSRSIAKHLALSSHDASTPVKLVHNSAAHLRGTSRSIGAAIVGYLGVRVFIPRPAVQAMIPIGGMWAPLAMCAMAADTEYLYAAMKCLFCALRINPLLREQMTNLNGFQYLSMMLKKKKDILNSNVIHLAFSILSGTDKNMSSSKKCWEDLLVDVQLWLACTPDLQRFMFEHFNDYAKDTNGGAKLLCDCGVVKKVVQFLLISTASERLEQSVVSAAGDLLWTLLCSPGKSTSDVLSFSQSLVSTIPSSLESQQTSLVGFRNFGLKIVRSLSESYPELVPGLLGFDFVLSFVHPALHTSSLYRVFDMLTFLLIGNSANIAVFKESKNTGKWLRDPTSRKQRQEMLKLIPSQQSSLQANLETVSQSGFFALQALMPDVSDISFSWLAMFSILIGRKANLRTEAHSPLTLDIIWTNLFHTNPGATMKFRDAVACSDAVLVLFSMVRKSVQNAEGGNATCGLQTIVYMYHNWSEFGQTAQTSEFLAGLASCLFTVSDQDPEFITVASPTRRLVLDLMRMIISDSLALPVDRFMVLMDSWLEPLTEKAQCQMYQTEIAEMIMEHITALNLVTNTSAMWIHPIGSRNNVASNIFTLAQRLVDKLRKKELSKLDRSVFAYLLANVEALLRHYDSNNSALEIGFGALNQLILYQISRMLDTVSSQMSVLDCLHNIVDHRSVVLHPQNSDSTFACLLAYCLAMLVDRLPINAELGSQTSWHSYPNMSSQILEGWHLLQTAACSVWNVLLPNKKKELCDGLKPPRNALESDLTDIKDFLRETGSRMWFAFLDELRGTPTTSSSVTGVSIAAVRKLPTSLVRAYSRQKTSKLSVVVPKISSALYLHQLRLHCLLVKQYVTDQLSHTQRSMTSLLRLVEDEWLECEDEFLLRERALFGPEEQWKLEKWLLDVTEGPQRVRKKLIRNKDFYVHYPYRESSSQLSSAEARQRAVRYPLSADSKLYDDEKGNHIKTLLYTSKDVSLTDLVASEGPKQSSELENSTDPSAKEEENDTEQSDDTVIRRLIEEGDTITYAFRCARVEGLDAYEGLMLFGKEHFYLIDGYTLLSTREIRDIESIPPSQREPVLPSVILGKRKRQKFHYDEIREVLHRRYLLQPIAIEIFCTNGRTNLLAFPRDVSQRVYARLLSVAPNITDSANQSVAGQKRSAQVEPQSGLLSSLMGEKSVTDRWVRGEISNFQYLMFLNTLSGRSYNDLMQYPVFPWILADYDSETLDLSDPSTFRDLSKPMGAQTDDRLQQYLKRYREWDPNTKDTPFIYGTHYSTAMIVASYLLRLEPFTQYFLHLQGGHFDLADRMFHSIKDGWLSASTNNMADVKELIPEFFYLPDFLLNTNKFDLGTKQNGVQLDHVVLPPWSKGDPREFIRMHREALESDYVSSHLHEFIDLVWGYKQRGPAAIEANNLFHSWMYEGVDLEKLSDPLEKQAFIAFINNFGQVPSQLFKKPHPAKKVTGQKFECIYHNLTKLYPVPSGKDLRSPVGHIISLERGFLALEQNKTPIPPHFGRYLAWGFPDHSLRVCSVESDRPTAVFEIQDEEEVLCAMCPTSEMFIIAGMTGIVSVYTLTTSKRLQLAKHMYGHYEPVTCLCASAAFSVALSGSKDRTCIVWDLDNLTFLRSLKGHPATVSAVGINDLTGDMATCAGTMLFYWNINGQLLSTVDTCQSQIPHSDQILCVAFSQFQEWDEMNVVAVGSTDGFVRFYSEQLVLVEDDQNGSTAQPIIQEVDGNESDPVVTLRRLSIHGTIHMSSDHQIGQSQDVDDILSPSGDSEQHRFETDLLPEKQPHSHSPRDVTAPPTIVINTWKSHWQRRLVLRRQLDVQKGLVKKSGQPAAPVKGQLSVTALSFSKDHKALHIGDSLGRVSSWISSFEKPSK